MVLEYGSNSNLSVNSSENCQKIYRLTLKILLKTNILQIIGSSILPSKNNSIWLGSKIMR